MNTTQVTASAAGPATPIAIVGQSFGGSISGSPLVSRYQMQPGVLLYAAPGGSLTAVIEVTGDQPDVNGNFPSPGHWMPLADDLTAYGSGGSGVSRSYPIKSMITGIRVNVLTYTSGAVTLTVVQ